MNQKHPELPQGFTPQIIKALNLRQFSILCAQFGFPAVFKRMGWDDFLQYWENQAVNPGETFAEFLRRVNVPV